MRSMHRCFLTDKTCYVVLVSNRDSDERVRSRYWLKNIASFARDSSVILALNQWDGVERWDIDESALKKAFPNLRAIVRYTANEEENTTFEALSDTIKSEVLEMNRNHSGIPDSWARVKRHLDEMNDDFIDQTQYEAICADSGVSADEGRRLLGWFNILGSCFSYHLDPNNQESFSNYKVLNPRWLTNAIYIIINCAKAENGMVTHDALYELLKKQERSVIKGIVYEREQLDYILEVMRNFQLSYQVGDREFIPALCPPNPPKEVHPTAFHAHTRYLMEYQYLPDTVVQKLMIACYNDGLRMDKLWSRGLRMDAKWAGLTAVVSMENDDQRLSIDLYSTDGKHATWELLSFLREKLLKINQGMNTGAKEKMVVRRDEDYEDYVSVKALLKAKREGREVLTVTNDEDGYTDYIVDDILGTYFDPLLTEKPEEKMKEVYRDVYNAQQINVFNNGGENAKPIQQSGNNSTVEIHEEPKEPPKKKGFLGWLRDNMIVPIVVAVVGAVVGGIILAYTNGWLNLPG